VTELPRQYKVRFRARLQSASAILDAVPFRAGRGGLQSAAGGMQQAVAVGALSPENARPACLTGVTSVSCWVSLECGARQLLRAREAPEAATQQKIVGLGPISAPE